MAVKVTYSVVLSGFPDTTKLCITRVSFLGPIPVPVNGHIPAMHKYNSPVEIKCYFAVSFRVLIKFFKSSTNL